MQEFLHWQVPVTNSNTAQNCANVTGIYDMKHKNNKRTHQVQLHNTNADRLGRLAVLLKAASEFKCTAAGKLFHTFTILFVSDGVNTGRRKCFYQRCSMRIACLASTD